MYWSFYFKYPWHDPSPDLITPFKVGYTPEEFLKFAPEIFLSEMVNVKEVIVECVTSNFMNPKRNPDSPEHVALFTMLCITLACLNLPLVNECVGIAYSKYSRGIIENDILRLHKLCLNFGWNFEFTQTQFKSGIFNVKMKISDYLPLIKFLNENKLLPENLTHDENYVYFVNKDLFFLLELGCREKFLEIIELVNPDLCTQFRSHIIFGEVINQIDRASREALEQRKESLCNESPIEEIFWKAIRNQIPGVVQQFWIGLYRIDFAIPDLQIAIECDGQEHHKSAKERTSDAQRDRVLKMAGYDVIRFTGTEIYRDCSKCIRELKQIIALKIPQSKPLQKNQIIEKKISERLPLKSLPFIFANYKKNSSLEGSTSEAISNLIEKQMVREMFSSSPSEFSLDLYSKILKELVIKNDYPMKRKELRIKAFDLITKRLSKIVVIFTIPPKEPKFKLFLRYLPEEERSLANEIHQIILDWYHQLTCENK